MEACRTTRKWTLPCWMRCRVSFEKKVLIALSPEFEGGVKWNGKRGFAAAKPDWHVCATSALPTNASVRY